MGGAGYICRSVFLLLTLSTRSACLIAIMLLPVSFSLLALCHLGRVAAKPVAPGQAPSVSETTCNGKKYVYEELAGWGILDGTSRDKFGDTIGGIGSAIALDKKSWKKKKGGNEAYDGIIFGLPDRGWNTQGTQNTQSRIHKFAVSLDIVAATLEKPASPNFQIKYLDTILLAGPDGTPVTGMLHRFVLEVLLIVCRSGRRSIGSPLLQGFPGSSRRNL